MEVLELLSLQLWSCYLLFPLVQFWSWFSCRMACVKHIQSTKTSDSGVIGRLMDPLPPSIPPSLMSPSLLKPRIWMISYPFFLIVCRSLLHGGFRALKFRRFYFKPLFVLIKATARLQEQNSLWTLLIASGCSILPSSSLLSGLLKKQSRSACVCACMCVDLPPHEQHWWILINHFP